MLNQFGKRDLYINFIQATYACTNALTWFTCVACARCEDKRGTLIAINDACNISNIWGFFNLCIHKCRSFFGAKHINFPCLCCRHSRRLFSKVSAAASAAQRRIAQAVALVRSALGQAALETWVLICNFRLRKYQDCCRWGMVTGLTSILPTWLTNDACLMGRNCLGGTFALQLPCLAGNLPKNTAFN